MANSPEARKTDNEQGESRRLASVGERGGQAAGHAGEEAARAGNQAAEAGRDAAGAGLQALAGMQAPLAEASFERSRHALQATVHVTDVYRDAVERTSDDVQALVASFAKLGRGLHQWQHACADLMQQSMERMHRKPQDLLRARSFSELAEVQRDLYTDLVDNMMTTNSALLQLTVRIAQDAVRPLQERASHRR